MLGRIAQTGDRDRASGRGRCGGPTGAGGGASRPDIPPAPDDLVISGADARLATAADGRAVVAVAALDGAIRVSSWGPSGGAATGVETWAPGVELAASADVDDPLHGGYASTISSIQDLELGDAGEAWLLYNRLQGTVSAASRINIYLRHRHAGADLGTWDAPELVAEVGVGWSAIRRRPRCGWHMRPPVT